MCGTQQVFCGRTIGRIGCLAIALVLIACSSNAWAVLVVDAVSATSLNGTVHGAQTELINGDGLWGAGRS